MREVIEQIEVWKKENKPAAIATNVKRVGVSLRALGAKMAVTTAREIAGSVTGGCIEGMVYEEAQQVIQSGQPKRLHYSAPGEENPWEIGLSCGGVLDVLVESLDSPVWQEMYPLVKTCLEQNLLAAVATVISGPELGKKMILYPDGRTLGDLGTPWLNERAAVWMQQQMKVQESDWTSFEVQNETVEVFVDVLVPSARLIVIGAVHIAIPLVEMAKTMGYHTIVIDPRAAFATGDRFPQVDELIVEWPSTALEKMHLDEGTYIAVISHDDKLDNPALQIALTSPARYVGVLGTRKHIPARLAVLREMGVSEEQLKRLCAPIGIHIAAVQPEEIALSILAEMTAARHGQLRS